MIKKNKIKWKEKTVWCWCVLKITIIDWLTNFEIWKREKIWLLKIDKLDYSANLSHKINRKIYDICNKLAKNLEKLIAVQKSIWVYVFKAMYGERNRLV